jgi:hypothetical protein
MRMDSDKGKLNLTVSYRKRKKAEALAARSNRSLSNLFEVLVEAEWARIKNAQSRSAGAQHFFA